MGSDKLTPLERKAQASAIDKAREAGRYREQHGRRAPWKPIAALPPTLKSIVWATQDILLAAFITATGLKPLAVVDVQGLPLFGFDRVPEAQLRDWESGPKGKVDAARFAEMRDRLQERCQAAKDANLQTLLLRM